jgi:hypothetical protein
MDRPFHSLAFDLVNHFHPGSIHIAENGVQFLRARRISLGKGLVTRCIHLRSAAPTEARQTFQILRVIESS